MTSGKGQCAGEVLGNCGGYPQERLWSGQLSRERCKRVT